MRLDNKGFVVSTLMYALLIVFLFLIVGIIALLSNRKLILDKLKKDVKGNINEISKYDYYADGEVVYYNPVTNKVCYNYSESNSLNETKTGCLKWYAFSDNINKTQVNLILDHNTTYNVAWNSTGTNTEIKEAQEELDKLVSNSKWQVTPRLITADEIATITENTEWSSSTATSNQYFFFGSNNTTGYSLQTDEQKAKQQSYAWLFDYTSSCTSFGCDTADSSTSGYWTSFPVSNNTNYAWIVIRGGGLNYDRVGSSGIYGVRPVITVDKSVLGKALVKTFSYTGKEQTFVAPYKGYYKFEAWGAQGARSASNGAYTSGYINLNKNENIYVYVGEGLHNLANSTAFNNGTGNQGGYNGGGATDFRLTSGKWDNSSSLASRIMVAAGSGSGTGNTTASAGAGGTLFGIAAGGTSGGTQTSAGAVQASSYTASSFGIANGGCTGGNGYYPGGGATCANGAGGGSSFISGYAGVNAVTSETNLTHTNNTIHYSGKYFINGVMKAGNELMPSHDGSSTMIGNSGNGYARITYIGTEKPQRKNTKLDSVRYIKDCTSGSSTNTSNHWVEVQAIKAGTNIAKGKTATGFANNTNFPISRITDGDITSENYAEGGNASQVCMLLDLGATNDLDEIAIWHYYTDGRTYNSNVISVSSDNTNWTTIISTTEPETVNGKRFSAYE